MNPHKKDDTFFKFIKSNPDFTQFTYLFTKRIIEANRSLSESVDEELKPESFRESRSLVDWPKNRRLDSFARLLLGNEKCVAVSYYQGIFFIATNNNEVKADLNKRVIHLCSLLSRLKILSQKTGSELSFIADDELVPLCQAIISANLFSFLQQKYSNEMEPAVLERLEAFINNIITVFFTDLINCQNQGGIVDNLTKFLNTWRAGFERLIKRVNENSSSPLQVDHAIYIADILAIYNERLFSIILDEFFKYLKDFLKVVDCYQNTSAEMIDILDPNTSIDTIEMLYPKIFSDAFKIFLKENDADSLIRRNILTFISQKCKLFISSEVFRRYAAEKTQIRENL